MPTTGSDGGHIRESKTELGLRVWVAKKLGRKDVPDELWLDLVERGFVRDVLDGSDSTARDDLLAEARRELKLGKALSPRRRLARIGPKEGLIRGLLTPAEAERARIFSRHLGRMAANDRPVVAARSWLPRGGLLSSLQAKRVFSSPAVYLLSCGEFESLEIPLVDHVAVATPAKVTGIGTGATKTVRLRLRVGQRTIRRAVELQRRESGEARLVLPLFEGGAPSPFPVVPGTVAAEFHKAVRWLIQAFPWNQGDAFWFLLTGQAPWVPPVQVGVQRQASERGFDRLVMSFAVEPWISAKTLMHVFRACQKEVLGRKNRAIAPSSLARFDFVEEHAASNGKSSWATKMRAWNADRPGERIADYRHLRRDHQRTRRGLMNPGYESRAVGLGIQKAARGRRSTSEGRSREE